MTQPTVTLSVLEEMEQLAAMLPKLRDTISCNIDDYKELIKLAKDGLKWRNQMAELENLNLDL